jgi:hypothetical protein
MADAPGMDLTALNGMASPSAPLAGQQGAADQQQLMMNQANITGQNITNQINQYALQQQQAAQAMASAFVKPAQTDTNGQPVAGPGGQPDFDKQGYVNALFQNGMPAQAMAFIGKDLDNQSKNITNNQQLQTLTANANGYGASYIANQPDALKPAALAHINQGMQKMGLPTLQAAPTADANGNPLTPEQQGAWIGQNVLPSVRASSMLPDALDTNARANAAAFNTPAGTDPNSPLSVNLRATAQKGGANVPSTMTAQEIMNTPGLSGLISTVNNADVQTQVTKANAVGDGVQYSKYDNTFSQIQQLLQGTQPEADSAGNVIDNISNYTNPKVQTALALMKQLPPSVAQQIDLTHGLGSFQQSVQSEKTVNAANIHTANTQATSPTISGVAASTEPQVAYPARESQQAQGGAQPSGQAQGGQQQGTKPSQVTTITDKSAASKAIFDQLPSGAKYRFASDPAGTHRTKP